jgi:hypothetical protein
MEYLNRPQISNQRIHNKYSDSVVCIATGYGLDDRGVGF